MNLVIYDQRGWRDDALIVGNREALLKLANAIITTVCDSYDGDMAVSRLVAMNPIDGEGYDVLIGVVQDEKKLQSLKSPYPDPGHDNREWTVWPDELIREMESEHGGANPAGAV